MNDTERLADLVDEWERQRFLVQMFAGDRYAKGYTDGIDYALRGLRALLTKGEK
jgi:hypothetical protein